MTINGENSLKHIQGGINTSYLKDDGIKEKIRQSRDFSEILYVGINPPGLKSMDEFLQEKTSNKKNEDSNGVPPWFIGINPPGLKSIDEYFQENGSTLKSEKYEDVPPWTL